LNGRPLDHRTPAQAGAEGWRAAASPARQIKAGAPARVARASAARDGTPGEHSTGRELLRSRTDVETTRIRPRGDGRVAAAELAAARRDDDTALAGFMAANSETGVLQPVEKTAATRRVTPRGTTEKGLCVSTTLATLSKRMSTW